jgi:hypothetical protein
MTENSAETHAPRDRTAPLLLGLAAMLAFTWLLQSMTALPFMRGPIYDSVVYAAQADAVRAGRFGDPSLVAFSPLYGYVLALLGGPTARFTIGVAQWAMWLATVALVFRSTVAQRDRRAALAGAALCSLHGPLLFYTGKILAESLGTLLAIGALSSLLAPSTRSARWRWTIGTGALLAFATLARASQLFALPLFVVAGALRWGRAEAALSLGLRARRAAGIALGIALVLGANGLWNQRNTGLFVPVILASRTLQRTTARDWRGRIEDLAAPGADRVSPWDVVDQARARIEAARRGEREPSGALVTVDWSGFARNLPRKLKATLEDREITSYMYSYYGEAGESPLLRWFPVSFGVLLLLGLAGAIGLAKREGVGALAPYAPFFLAGLAACLLYHPSARYRLPMVYPLLLLAGPAVMDLFGSLRTESPRRRALSGAVALVVIIFVARHLAYRTQNPALWNASVARAHALAGEMPEAAARIAAARRSGPVSADTERFIRAIPMR